MISNLYTNIPFSLPPYIERVKDKLEYKITFNESCIYDHGDIDQWDWNKLIGVKKNFFSPRKNSFMVGWRWNKEKDRLELTNYSHDVNGKAFYNDRGIFYISREELKDPIIVKLDLIKQMLKLTIKSKHFAYGAEFREQLFKNSVGIIGWVIRDWFGGTKLTPHKMTKEFIKIK